MQQVIAIHDLTQMNLGRVLIGTLQRQRITGLETTMGKFPNVVISSGGWRSPGFSRTAMICVLVDPGELRDNERKLTILQYLTPHIHPSNKVMFIEHQLSDNLPKLPDVGGERLWRKEAWLLNHYSTARFNLRFFKLKMLSSLLMEVYLHSWPLGGDGSYLGRDLAPGDNPLLRRGMGPVWHPVLAPIIPNIGF